MGDGGQAPRRARWRQHGTEGGSARHAVAGPSFGPEGGTRRARAAIGRSCSRAGGGARRRQGLTRHRTHRNSHYTNRCSLRPRTVARSQGVPRDVASAADAGPAPRRHAARAPRRRHRRRRRRGHRPGPREGGAGRPSERRGPRPRPPARPRASRWRSSPPRATEALDLIRHDAAHVLAAAVMELYPGVKISIGPPIDNGFYYDFEFPEGVDVLRRGLRAPSRRRCASTSRPTSRSCARTCRSPRRSSASAPRVRTTRSS